MKTGDETVDSMFDEIVETRIAADGSVEVNLVDDPAQEMEAALRDYLQSWRRFSSIDPAMATSYARLGIEWWKAAEYLMLADSRLKECFCGRDRNPRSVRQFHRWKVKMLLGRRCRTDA